MSYICACQVNKCKNSVSPPSSLLISEWFPRLLGDQTESSVDLHARTFSCKSLMEGEIK